MLGRPSAHRGGEHGRGVDTSWESVMISKLVARFSGDRSGIAAMEYGLIGLLVLVGVVATMTLVGDGVGGTYDDVVKKMPDQG